MNSLRVGLLALLLVAPATALAQSEDDGQHLYWALDRMLLRLEGRLSAPDAIAPDLRPGRHITVADNSGGMNVETGAEVLEALPNDRYRVRVNGAEKVLNGKELRALNLPYVIRDGSRVMAGGSIHSGAVVRVDRVNDVTLGKFLGEARAIGEQPVGDLEKLRRLDRLVNTWLKYPAEGDPAYRRLDADNRGREVEFGRFLHEGKGVCRHMALAMKLALDAVGIRSRYVAGEALASGTYAVRGGHAWVEALTTDGKRLLVDPTWHDPGVPLESAYKKGELRRPKPSARRIIPPGETAPAGGDTLADLLDTYRRPADGTLEWRRMARDGLMHEGGALAQFGLALFLKELAVVARTGDRLRIEEFFDGLLSTDFYVHYGLFVAGARVGEVAYVRYLQQYVRPRFVNGVLRTNLVLATGMALPLLVSGQFEGKAFAISLGSLGLSSAAVRAGVSGIKWVTELRRPAAGAGLARAGVGLSRLARLGAWVYTAAELAVVLYVAEELDQAVHAALDQEAAESALADAGEAFARAVGDPAATPEEVAAAADQLHEAWSGYRNFLYRELEADEAQLAHRLQGLARRAKLAADERRARLDRLATQPALRRNVERRFGSLSAYADAQEDEAHRELAGEVNEVLAAYERSRAGHLDEVYREGGRAGGLLDGVEDLAWHLTGGGDRAAGDPYGGRADVFATWGRARSRSDFRDALEGASTNRLQTYADERELLEATQRALRGQGRGAQADALDGAIARVVRTGAADRALFGADDGIAVLPPPDSPGAAGALERAIGD